jgi:pentatricopeptide repeat protein
LLEGKTPDIDKALSVFKVMGSPLCGSLPNRQSFNIIIRALASSGRPSEAEAFLTRMTTEGFTPDVDLFTLTVTSYERNREPIKALQLMESMRENGYDFYDIKVVNEAFKKAIKIVNVMGRGFTRPRSTSADYERDASTSFLTELDDLT